jgi:hypothetical protein
MARLPIDASNMDEQTDASQSSGGSDPSETLQTLMQATQALTFTNEQLMQALKGLGVTASPDQYQVSGSSNSADNLQPNEAPVPVSDEDTRSFHHDLEQAGRLVEVDANTDRSQLPPHVTHVRNPDGSVERISFSSSYSLFEDPG